MTDTRIIQKMADALLHRGPDDSGVWSDHEGLIQMAHRRLSIVDLSRSGHQPMSSRCNRYVISFNGEIYNHLDLRSELSKSGIGGAFVADWRGSSDTETLLAGFATWGIKATVERCIGMFAFALWDRKKRVLTLGRDRLGEKPLYYGWQGQGSQACFLFGSELKALKIHPAFSAEINSDALRLLMRLNYVPAPLSIYCNIQKLQPGCLLSIGLDKREPVIERYWSLTEIALAGNKSPLLGSTDSIVNELELLLSSVIRQQMMADVPLGAFLSGGVDSSAVVALMQAQSERPIKTFTIGFDEVNYNEA
jgi:asparagine synthase (glutamine-hydrolysing)